MKLKKKNNFKYNLKTLIKFYSKFKTIIYIKNLIKKTRKWIKYQRI